jgi:hypothetical protein
MPFDFDPAVGDSLSNDLQAMTNPAFESAGGDVAAAVENWNNRCGRDSSNPLLTRDDSGKFKLNDKTFTADEIASGESLKTKLESLEIPEAELGDLNTALKDPALTNVSGEIQQTAKLSGDRPAVKTALETNPRYQIEEGKANNDANLKNVKNDLENSNKIAWGKIMKYTLMAGLSAAAMFALAKAGTGCYAEYSTQKQKLSDLASDTCAFLTDGTGGAAATINNAAQLDCATPCQNYIGSNSVSPFSQKVTDLSKTSCNCSNNTSPTTKANPNVTLVYETPSVWDVFGNILNAAGMFIQGIENGLLKLVDAAADALGDIGKIFMYVGIGVGVIVVVAVLGFLFKKLSDKSKEKKLNRGIKGGKKRYKDWKKLQKQIKKHTPQNQLTLSNMWM